MLMKSNQCDCDQKQQHLILNFIFQSIHRIQSTVRRIKVYNEKGDAKVFK